ncbi:MAG TPA: DNA repair protein RadC [Actinomycetota bacterium]
MGPARVSDYSPADRPRERLTTVGPAGLSDAEVLSLILGTGGREGVMMLAARVLSAVGGPGGLARATERELAEIPGVGPAKAAELVAALELGRRAARGLAGERAQVWRPADAAALLVPRLAHLDREESVVLILDRKHRLLREVLVGVGGVAHTPMEPREVFAAALREPGAAAVIVAHNHPSGDVTPSTADIAITRRLRRGAELLGLEFVDHLVIGARDWRSLVELAV